MFQTPVNVIKGYHVQDTVIHDIYGRTWHTGKCYKHPLTLQTIELLYLGTYLDYIKTISWLYIEICLHQHMAHALLFGDLDIRGIAAGRIMLY